MAVLSVLATILFTLLLLQESHGDVCVDGDVRLVGGSSYLEGRVEVCFAAEWGTVCDDEWDQNEASVVCRQLGFSAIGASSFSDAQFGQGSGDIVFDNLQCTGNESSLFRCLTINQCSHTEDAGVRCQDNDIALVYRGLLLVNNSLISLESLISSDPISCVSTLPSCCNTTRAGNWFSPNSTTPLGSSTGTGSFYQSWGDDRTIQLHRPNAINTTQEGLYRCDVPDAENTTHTFYVGIYATLDDGAVNITSLVYEKSSHMLVCTSTGGPATSIMWSKDGVPLEVDRVTYLQSQIILDTVDSTYENRLQLLNKSSSQSGLYGCSATNAGGRAFDSTQLEVCRDDEVRVVISEDRITSALEVCEKDSWQRTTEYPFRIPVTEPAPRNVQVQPHMRGFSVSWELPASSADILSQEVMCTDQNGLTISMVVDPLSTLTVIPVTSSMPTECCVSTIISRSTIGTLAAQTCASSDLLTGTTGMSPTQGSDVTKEGVVVFTPAPQSSDQTLVFVLGGVAAVLFLSLLIVVVVVVGLIILHARNKKGDTVEEMEMSGGNGIAPSLDSKEKRNPIYDSVEPPELPQRPTENDDETSPSNILPSVPTRANVHNPMYTSIEDLKLRRTSFGSMNRTSPARDAVLRSNSTSALLGRKVVPAKTDSTPSYSMIVPRHLRKKAPSPMEEQDADSSQNKASSPSADIDHETYSKLQH